MKVGWPPDEVAFVNDDLINFYVVCLRVGLGGEAGASALPRVRLVGNLQVAGGLVVKEGPAASDSQSVSDHFWVVTVVAEEGIRFAIPRLLFLATEVSEYVTGVRRIIKAIQGLLLGLLSSWCF